MSRSLVLYPLAREARTGKGASKSGGRKKGRKSQCGGRVARPSLVRNNEEGWLGSARIAKWRRNRATKNVVGRQSVAARCPPGKICKIQVAVKGICPACRVHLNLPFVPFSSRPFVGLIQAVSVHLRSSSATSEVSGIGLKLWQEGRIFEIKL